MYKIYINETPLLLTNNPKNIGNLPSDSKNLVVSYMGKSKSLLNYIDMLEKKQRDGAVIIHYENYEKLEKDFLGLFKIIEAAGGVVINQEDKLLAIYRMGWWDLPKGKIEPLEKKKAAAIREVKEECGLKDVSIIQKLGNTYHTFGSKEKRKLKISTWYAMHSSDKKLIPQLEEDIEKAEWMTVEKFLEKAIPVYPNILDVVEAYQLKKNK